MIEIGAKLILTPVFRPYAIAAEYRHVAVANVKRGSAGGEFRDRAPKDDLLGRRNAAALRQVLPKREHGRIDVRKDIPHDRRHLFGDVDFKQRIALVQNKVIDFG